MTGKVMGPKKLRIEVTGDELEKLSLGKSGCSPTSFELEVAEEKDGLPVNFIGTGKSHFNLRVLHLKANEKWMTEPVFRR